MAAMRIVWCDLLCASEHVIMEYLETLEGIPQYAYAALASYLHSGYLISNTLLNELEIEPRFWSQFDDEEDEFDMSVTYNSDDLSELLNEDNYHLSMSKENDLFEHDDVAYWCKIIYLNTMMNGWKRIHLNTMMDWWKIIYWDTMNY